MMKSTYLQFPLLVLILLLIGCGTDKTEEKTQPLVSEIIIGEDGHFRGRFLGDSMDKAVTADREFLFKRTQDELNYSIPFSSTDSAHYDVAYVFDQFGLFEIQVDVYSSSRKETTKLFNQFRDLMVVRYGSPIEKEGSAFWDVKQEGRKFEVTLRDESEDYGKPFLSLNILEPQSHNF